MRNKLPLIQQRFWTNWKLDNKRSSYNMAFEYRIYGDLNLYALIKALKTYVFLVNPLCTCKFLMESEGIFYAPVENHILNVRIEDEILEKENASAVRESFFFRPFDLENGNVYRFLIVKNVDSYTLLASFHHIIIDTISYTAFLKTLSDVYHDVCFGTQRFVPPAPALHQFLDYEQKSIKRADLEACLKDFSADSLQVNLFSDVDITPSDNLLTGRSLNFETNLILFEKLKAFVERQGTTLFRVIMATFASLLKFYSGQSSVSINYPINLLPKELQGLSGSFVNVLPLSLQFSPTSTFLHILDQITTHRKLAKSYQWLPYEEIVAFLRGKKRITSDDFANVCLSEALGMLRQETPSFQGAQVQPLPVSRFEPMFDITFCYGITSNLLLQIDYDSAKFSAEFIRGFSNHFLRLLSAVIDNPEQPLSLNLIYKPEDFKHSYYSMPINKPAQKLTKSLANIFSETAHKHSERQALVFVDKKYNYESLESKSNQWATYIRSVYRKTYGMEMPQDTLIGLCIDRDENMILGILGILKSGAAYVPIDPKSPQDRVMHILNDSQPALILTYKTHSALLQARGSSPLIFMDDETVIKSVASESETVLNISIDPQSLAYIIYTSGSTGQPKGVMVSHENVIRLFTVTNRHFHFNENDSWSLFHSFAFDFSVWEMWGAFIYGGTLHLVSYEISRDPREFYHWVQSKGITVLNQTPSAFQKFVEEDKNYQTQLSSLKYIIFGGEALHKKSLRTWAGKYGIDSPALINMYGITETTVHVTYKKLDHTDLCEGKSNIGVPLDDLSVYILDEAMHLCPPGVPGEMYVAGPGVTRGYLNRKELTAQRFVYNPFADLLSLPESSKLYKSGDLARIRTDGNLEYLGRKDAQVKLRGFRIELGEIEAVLMTHPSIAQTAVVLDPLAKETLIAYYKSEIEKKLDETSIRNHLARSLPDYMVPAKFIQLSDFPINNNGKADFKRFPEYIVKNKEPVQENDISDADASQLEKALFSIWSDVLNKTSFNRHASFFDLGGSSFAILQVREKIEAQFNVKISAVDLFQYTTIEKLSNYLSALVTPYPVEDKKLVSYEGNTNSSKGYCEEDIAVVGIACRVPGAKNPEDFWNLLVQGQSSIRDFSIEELKLHQLTEQLAKENSYVKRASILEDSYNFDATFFGYSIKEAEIMDPQQRQFLECAWEALENSGNVPEKFQGEIGIFASQGRNYYYLDHIHENHNYSSSTSEYQAMLGNEKDFLSTKISFKLNLSGPSINIQTGCSSSLVAIHMACQSLRTKDCDMALAGGVSLFYKYGYPYQEGMILSPDGYCRAFDADAKGTVAGSGMGIVVLKRLKDAIAQNDTIYAVIKGSAINNDGASKIGYTAPSIEGQIAVIEKALQNANVHPETIGYIEAHGTGTPLGDPIEWAALHRVYEKYTSRREFCTIGSVKTNIGHTDAASGVLGFIKAVLSLKNKIIPATLNFKVLNPEISTFNSLFKANNQPVTWQNEEGVRRAAVSSLGIGGTNAHIVLESYDEEILADKNLLPEEEDSYFLIPFSAKNQESLYLISHNIKNYIETQKPLNFQDMAFTAQQGRAEFEERGYFLISKSSANDFSSAHVFYKENNLTSNRPNIIFDFSAQDDNNAHEASRLYKKYKYFREAFEYCAELIKQKYRVDIKFTLMGAHEIKEDKQGKFLSFAIGYAMAQLLIASGIQPDGIVARGVGTGLAATISGVFSLKDALDLFFQKRNISPTILGMKKSCLKIKILSHQHGNWITDQEAKSNEFWENFIGSNRDFPKTSLAENYFLIETDAICRNHSDAAFLNLIGKLWILGIKINWKAISNSYGTGRKISIPTYAFIGSSYRVSRETPYIESAKNSKTFSEIQSSSEEVVLKTLWSKALGVLPKHIENETNFIELGGDSMASIQLMDDIRECFAVDVLFEELESSYDFGNMLDLITSKKKYTKTASTIEKI